jgi:hypothetical protein
VEKEMRSKTFIGDCTKWNNDCKDTITRYLKTRHSFPGWRANLFKYCLISTDCLTWVRGLQIN